MTRDAALEVCYKPYHTPAETAAHAKNGEEVKVAWGSGYPSDARTSTWLKANMDPIFGWGNECRFSWGTAKELLEGKKADLSIDWPVEDDGDDMRVTDFFNGGDKKGDELVEWFGKRVTVEMEAF